MKDWSRARWVLDNKTPMMNVYFVCSVLFRSYRSEYEVIQVYEKFCYKPYYINSFSSALLSQKLSKLFVDREKLTIFNNKFIRKDTQNFCFEIKDMKESKAQLFQNKSSFDHTEKEVSFIWKWNIKRRSSILSVLLNLHVHDVKKHSFKRIRESIHNSRLIIDVSLTLKFFRKILVIHKMLYVWRYVKKQS